MKNNILFSNKHDTKVCVVFSPIWLCIEFESFNDFKNFFLIIRRGSRGLGGNSNIGGMNLGNLGGSDMDQSYNTYGLSTSFLESLGIQGPLHTKVFVANVSKDILLRM